MMLCRRIVDEIGADHQVNEISASGERRPRPRLPRAGMLAAAAAAVAVLATACGGGSSPSSTAAPLTLSALTDQALAYAKCMRAHGIPDFPDPSVQDNAHSKGVGFNLGSDIDTHSAQFTSAAKLCQKQTGFGHISTAQLQAGMAAMPKFAECMRSHGIANFPDPFENSHQIGFSTNGIDMNSSRVKAAQATCRPLMPGGGP
jgi:hypothetical protein